jgi:hypothetical protein
MMAHERLLHRMQLFAVGEPLDGPDRTAVGLDGKHETGPDGLAIDEDGAGPAHPMLAADMRPGLPAIVADDVTECASRFDRNRMIHAVDSQGDVDLVGHAAFSSARCTMVRTTPRR